MNFKKKIKSLGLKQKRIAQIIGVNETLLSLYLTGARDMPIDVQEKLKELLKKYEM